MRAEATRGNPNPHGWWRIALVLVLVPSIGCSVHAPRVYQVQTDKPFADVLIDLEFAITDNNYRITGRNDIGAAIAARQNRPYPNYAVIHFCNLRDAQQILDVAPEFLVHMPCRISVREHAGDVIIEARLVPEHRMSVRKISRRINAMLREIADSAAGF
ncbi:MAG: DUF302 domain-containing protein [Gammaproteobacteria bacterium]|nr:DUF302 domain-containing protein [Gammaproteobacteria bacterium]